MITQAQNELLTQTGPGTPMGQLFRKYWIPAFLSERLPEPDGAPIRIRLVSEQLVAFRDTSGRVGILDEFCPHRRASLVYGRNEEGGIRCIFHGWKLDATGCILEAPAERSPRFAETVRSTAYPTHEAGGIVWTYMGDRAEIPPFPDFGFTSLPESHLIPVHYFQECNYLQAVEADVDLVHSSWLHSVTGPLENASVSGINVGEALRFDRGPSGHVADTEWGFYNIWEYKTPDPDQRMFWVHPFIFPCYTVVASSRRERILTWHAWVPVDDEHHLFYYVHYDPEMPINDEERKTHMKLIGHEGVQPDKDYRHEATLANRHLQDQQLMKTVSFSGIPGIAPQDMAVQQSMGPIVDRTKEHLGSEDSTVRHLRRVLMRAAEGLADGKEPPVASDHSETIGYFVVAPNSTQHTEVLPGGSAYGSSAA